MQDFGQGRPFSLPGSQGSLPLLTNGGIDLYALLELPPSASIEELRERIGALYNQALANAEHRDIGRRHYFENLLEFLPRCYEILLDGRNRREYDAYLVALGSDPGLEPFVVQASASEGKETELPVAHLLDIRTPEPVITDTPLPLVETAGASPTEFAAAFSTGAALAGLTAGLVALVGLRTGLLWSTATASLGGLTTAVFIALLLSMKRNRTGNEPD